MKKVREGVQVKLLVRLKSLLPRVSIITTEEFLTRWRPRGRISGLGKAQQPSLLM